LHITPEIDQYARIADLYDHVVPYRDRDDIGFFIDAARAAGSPVLEVGCGTGRVLIPVARAGIEIVGIDASAAMLAVCRERLSKEPREVSARTHVIRADMRRFDLGQTFTLATIPFRPFQHLLTVDDQLACLRCIRTHLAEGGRLILDAFNPLLEVLAQRPTGEEAGDEPAFTTPDGRHVVRRHRILAHDRFARISDIELIYYVTHPDGRKQRTVHAFQMRYLFRFELEHLLVRAGYTIERLYAGYDRSDYGSTYPGELIFVARKGST